MDYDGNIPDTATGLRQVIQDLVAPDLKSIQARQDGLSKQLEMVQQQLAIQMMR